MLAHAHAYYYRNYNQLCDEIHFLKTRFVFTCNRKLLFSGLLLSKNINLTAKKDGVLSRAIYGLVVSNSHAKVRCTIFKKYQLNILKSEPSFGQLETTKIKN